MYKKNSAKYQFMYINQVKKILILKNSGRGCHKNDDFWHFGK